MGSFYVNITLVGPRQNEIVHFLRKKGRECYVSPTINGRTVIYDRDCERHGEEDVEFCRLLSRQFSCPAMWVMNFKDDVLFYFFFDKGRDVDSYMSSPNFFIMEKEEDYAPPEGGDATLLCEAFGVPDRAKEVAEILRRDSAHWGREGYVLEVKRNEDLARALDMHPVLACVGYEYAENGEAAAMAPDMELTHLEGTGLMDRIVRALMYIRRRLGVDEKE